MRPGEEHMEWCEDTDFQTMYSVKQGHPASQIHLVWELFRYQIIPRCWELRIK